MNAPTWMPAAALCVFLLSACATPPAPTQTASAGSTNVTSPQGNLASGVWSNDPYFRAPAP